jgi:AraC-like DNA-binding protein
MEFLSAGTGVVGILIAVPLLLMWRSRPPNFWLGMFILSISSLCLADYFIGVPGLFGVFDWSLAGLPAYGYLYLRGVTGHKNTGLHRLHLAPQALFIGVILWIRHDQPGWTRASGAFNLVFHIAFLASMALALAYLAAGLILVRRHRRRVRGVFSSVETRDIRWLGWLLVALAPVCAAWLLACFYGGIWLWVLGAGRLGLLYFIAWAGSRQVAVFIPEPVAAPPPAGPKATSEKYTEKYARSGMTEDARDLIGQRLDKRMREHQDFLDNDLTLPMLAERIGASPQLVSQYLNDHLQLSFFDYVNGLRVAEVACRLADPRYDGATLLTLSTDCGFNSKSTFNAAFKRVHGMTPSAWRAAQAARRQPIPAQT